MAPNPTQSHHLSACFGNSYFTSPKFQYGINPTLPRFHLGNHISSYVLWLGKYNSFRVHNPSHPRLSSPNRVLWERESKTWDGPGHAKLKPLPNPSVTCWVQPNRSLDGKHRLARRNLLYIKANSPDPKEVRKLQEMERVEMRNRRRSQKELGHMMGQELAITRRLPREGHSQASYY